MAGASGTGSASGSPCGACKFLRRKCSTDCVFAPYFCSEQGPESFAAIHKVFGASNVSKLLLNIPAHDRCEAVVTIAYEAQARIRDPVYGCVAHIFALQQQVAYLQAQLMQVKSQLAQAVVMNSQDNNTGNQCYWQSGNNSMSSGDAPTPNPSYPNYMNPISPQSSLESAVEQNMGSLNIQEIQSCRSEDFPAFQAVYCPKKRTYCSTDQQQLGELQALALRMMRN